jgi:hypothetical protein
MYEDVLKRMANRIKTHPEKMKLRNQFVEYPFGTIKETSYRYYVFSGSVARNILRRGRSRRLPSLYRDTEEALIEPRLSYRILAL